MTWRERIIAARGRGRFTAEDRRLAYDYCTCAVGEQAQRGVIPDFTVRGVFLDSPAFDATLYDLGGVFFNYVQQDRMDEAEDLLERIEARALTLKRERP